jgi:5-formyltetrahydrofolate cyclo-ligase
VAEGLLEAASSAGLLYPEGRPGRVGRVVLAGYLAMPGEPDPAAVCAAVRDAGGRVLLPRPSPGTRLEWAWDDGTRAVPNAPVRVPVPGGPAIGEGYEALLAADVRVLLLPALAVDEAGHRLGQGGGYYDRLLADRPLWRDGAARLLVVAVVHDDEVLPAGRVPVDDLDQPIDAALTPSGLRRFPNGASAGSGG